MIIKFVASINSVLYYAIIFLGYFTASKSFEAVLKTTFPSYWINGSLPAMVLIAPFLYWRYKAKPEEFPHLKGKEHLVPYFYIGVFILGIVFTVFINYIKE